MTRHPHTRTWAFPADRPALGLEERWPRINLRELVARPERFEHHLVVCAQLGPAQLEIVTASEPLYFGHVNISDEYAVALPTGDALLDAFPLRTFVSDAETGADLGRYNHHSRDLVLHPVGHAHWPGRLRPPYEGMAIPPDMRRCGLSLVYCASVPTPSNARPVALAAARAGDVKPYAPGPLLSLADLAAVTGVVATIGTTALAVVERPDAIAPPRGGWVVILDGTDPHAACDLIRIEPGAALPGAGITRALVLSGDAPPAPVPPSWHALPAPPFLPYEDAPHGALPFVHGELSIASADPDVEIAIGDVAARVPRYWLARMLFRVALHDLRLNHVETYGGLFVAERGDQIAIGLRTAAGRSHVAIPRAEALGVVERMYRAIAPPGYSERLA